MRWIVFVGSLLLVSAFFWYQVNKTGDIPQPGQVAPGFDLPDQAGKMHKLSDYRGKWLVLYFYPKDDTPVCTKEACAFRDGYSKITSAGANIVGISMDAQKSHADFASKNRLPFTLLSDPSGKVVDQYGVLMNLLLFKLARRYTFLIDPQGRVVKVYDKVQVLAQVGDVLEDLKKYSGK
ncbi:MAG: peroxiredoxin [Burkholderiales bacterium]|nr:peroxiredoxin [Burkholderiales bacterium]